MILFKTGIPQYHPLQRILRLPVFSKFKMQVIAGRYTGMPDITDMPTDADIASLFHVQLTQVRI